MERLRAHLREDWASLLLLTLLLFLVVWSLLVADWVEGLGVLPTLLVLGVAAGYLLAVSRFRALPALLTALVYGGFAVGALAGQVLGPGVPLPGRLVEVGTRLAVWVQQAVSGGFSRDNLIFLLFVSVMTWLLAVHAVWSLFREGRLWRAVVPSGIALLVNAYQYFGSAQMELFVGAYIFLTFSLAVLTNATIRARLWQMAGMGMQPGVRFDLLRGGMLAVVVLLGLAWFAPAAQASDQLARLWEESQNPWQTVQDTFERLFNAVEGAPENTPTYYGSSTLSLGGPVNLSAQPVMLVSAPQGYHYYWRSRVFDAYLGGRWWSNADGRRNSDFGLLRAEQSEAYALRENIQQRFQVLVPATRLVYAAPQVISFASLPVTYDLLYTTAPSEEFGTITTVQSRRLLEQNEVYGATSSVSIADEASLRGAGTDYPVWVREHYLPLPPSITTRTQALAEELAAPADNPYDAARAIESYLRRTIAYNEQVPAPPDDAEPVDYVLFESQEGYCVYYASAMTVLLRANGIPARVAAGFAQGEYDEEIDAYVVAEADAHTWVEAYFPGYGWIEFEPTAGRPAIERVESMSLDDLASPALDTPLPTPQPDVPEPLEEEPQLPESEFDASPLRRTLWVPPLLRWVGLLGALGAAVVGGAWFWFERRGLGGLSDVARSYAHLNTYAPWVGVNLAPGDTPYERGEAFQRAVPGGDREVREIVDLYVHEQYTRRRLAGREEDADSRARQAWGYLRRQFLRAGLLWRLARRLPFVGKDTTIR